MTAVKVQLDVWNHPLMMLRYPSHDVDMGTATHQCWYCTRATHGACDHTCTTKDVHSTSPPRKGDQLYARGS
eukprot:1753791-Amphidinium_carterae.1